MRDRMSDGLYFCIMSITITIILCLQDSSNFHVTASRSEPAVRTQPIPSSRKNRDDRKASQSYRSNAELFAAMREYASRCSNISRVYTVGKSVKGVPLMVLEISDFPGQFEAEPAFKYVGNMHGDEPTGRELTLYLAEWLCANYLNDSLATFIVQNVHLHLLPSMNPDGFESRTRNNANDVDLNRDFPDQYNRVNNNESGRQPETLAIMQWVRNIAFTASASLHEGALVASYGWDGTATGRTGYAESPDDAGFRYMSSLYAQSHPLMKSSPEFLGGITNGAAWYALYGGMQDWNYIHGNCFEITLEMSEEKWPDISKLPELWQQHQKSMLELVASVAKIGVHGKTVSAADRSPLPAMIIVKGNEHIINASAVLGDYHRLLPPGKNYELTAKFPGYISRQTTVVLSQWKATTLDFVLEPVPTSQNRPKQVKCGEDVAFHCTGPGLESELLDKGDKRDKGDKGDQGTRPWLSRKLVRSLDPHQVMASTAGLEHYILISAGAVVILVALFVVARRRRSLKVQPMRYLSRKPQEE